MVSESAMETKMDACGLTVGTFSSVSLWIGDVR